MRRRQAMREYERVQRWIAGTAHSVRRGDAPTFIAGDALNAEMELATPPMEAGTAAAGRGNDVHAQLWDRRFQGTLLMGCDV